MSGLVGRVLIAVPLLVIAILAVVVGGWPMVALAVAFGVIAMHEYGAATRSLRPLTIAGFAGVIGIIVVTHQGGLVWSLAPLMGTLLLAFWLSAVADVRQAATVQLSVTLLGVVWIGYGLAFLVALRDIPAPADWGKQLLIAVLVGVWLSDTFAYFGGRMFGKRKLASAISPNKTVEGLVIGFVLGAVAVFFTLYNQPSRRSHQPAERARVRRRDRGRVAGGRPVRELPEARHGRQGHRPAAGRPRRRARPHRRPAVRRRRRLSSWRWRCIGSPSVSLTVPQSGPDTLTP